LGGEELKIPVFALLLFGVGLLIQIPNISAQEGLQEGFIDGEIYEQEASPVVEDPLRAAEEAFAIGGDADAAAPVTVSGSSIWIVIRMILVLSLVAAAVYGAVFFIKRSSKQTAAADPFLKILASAPLGFNRYAHVVSVGGKAWLLGSSDGGVNLIGEIDDKDVINAMLLEDSRKGADAATGRLPDFLAMLRRLGTPAESRTSGADEIRRRRERLKGL
jgi:flagellar protein FliO/FliZ